MTVENELFDLEKQYWQALKDKDVATAMRLSDEPTTVAGASGVGTLTREALGKMMEGATWTLQDFRLADLKVRQLSEDVAVVAYKVHEELIVEGKPVQLDAADASTWVRRDGRWLCALHTESLAGDPFGRDRRS
jgi:hypothetical protein